MPKHDATWKKADRLPSRQAILRLLKRQGPTDAEGLALQLGISAMAVRQHLYRLNAEKLVSCQEQRRPVGRPAKMWSLTPGAAHLFPDAHADLSVNLLNAIDRSFGAQGIKRVVSQCAQQQIQTYKSRIPACGSIQSRLKLLISLRNEEGYMAETDPQSDGSFLLIENHCAISAAAKACPKLC